MRKYCLHLTLIATAAIAIGCEDGPNQTFQPSPGNAAGAWNNSDASTVTPGPQGFDASYPTSNATTLCSTDFRRDRWAWMLTQPIIPPRFYAGLDMAKNDQWDGLKIDDAERPPADATSPTGGLCQSNPFGFEGTCPSGFGGCNLNTWGNNNEVNFSWNVATHYVDQMVLGLGYTGTLTTNKYPDHNGELHAYTIQIGDVIRRDGQPYQIPWQDIPSARVNITDIFNAVMSTFSEKAGVPFDTTTCDDDSKCTAPGTVSACQCAHATDAMGNRLAACATGKTGQCGVANCGTDGNCLVYNDGSTTIFGVRPMVVYVQGTGGVPQPALSTPIGLYNFFSKWEPFSNLPQTVKLDADGPIATGTPVGVPTGSTTVCTQQIGQTFADFKKNCVQVHGDTTNPNGVDVVNLNKVEHSLTHDQEHWTANVLGVNQNFTSMKVLNNPDIVVLDTDAPEDADIAQDWTFDVRARGAVQNDRHLQASAMIYIEWARLMLQDIAAMTGKPVKKLGDPQCVGFTGNVPNYQISNAGCSGIEGMIIPHPSGGNFTADPSGLDAGINYDFAGLFGSVLKPGAINGGLCIDPGPTAMTDCTADEGKSAFANLLNHVTRVMGNGDVNHLPSELQDRRYYFKWFGIAYTKYLKAYGHYLAAHPTTANNFPTGTAGSGLGPSDVMNTVIDYEALFFDYNTTPGVGAAQTYDKFEYVDREFVGQGAGGIYNFAPWDFEYGCDLFGGNQRYDNWFRRMDREEIGLYSAMLVDKTKTPGAENNVNITNLFGSVMLGGDLASNVSGVWPTYECAAGIDPDPVANCGTNAPLDPVQSGTPCSAAGTCAGTKKCITAKSYEAGSVQACGAPCDFNTYPKNGCQQPYQVCAIDGDGATTGCLDAMMDLNGHAPNGKTLLSYYPAAWSRSPFSRGHSPITLAQADKHSNIGVAKVTIPNFADGPYTDSPQPADAMGACPIMGWSKSTNGIWCNAPLNAGTGTLAPKFSPLTPWLEVQPEIGFRIPIDGQHDQYVASGQFDYTGVLESYIVDYVPYTDKQKASCVSDGQCNKGFVCNPSSHDCVTDDNTISILAIEGADFLGEAFLCVDPTTSDVLHVRMYDSALSVIDWLAAHPGTPGPYGPVPSAQSACQIIIRRTPYDNFIDSISSKTNGVTLNVSGGQGLGRVTDIVLFDPTLVQAL